MIIGVDIDGTLTLEVEGHSLKQYKNRTPNWDMIRKVNYWVLVEHHEVVLFSARHEEDREVTVEWLKKYNVPYRKLILGKPHFDLYIDDISKRPEEVYWRPGGQDV
jgi:uncharacterized HAD superfamily protein